MKINKKIFIYILVLLVMPSCNKVSTVKFADVIPKVSISSSSSSGYEGSSVSFTVSLSQPTTVDVKYYWSIVNGTTTNSDFSATSGSDTIPAGQTTAAFSITPLDDGVDEIDETYTVQLTSADNGIVDTAAFSVAETVQDTTLYFDFTTGSMPSGLTYSRASTATYFDSSGVLQTAASNVPRFDYDPATHAIRGLLLENSRTNKLVRSAEFDNASWTKTGTSVVANTNQVTSLDGGNNAELVTEDNANSVHGVSQTAIGCAAGNYCTMTVFVRPAIANPRNYVQIMMQDTANAANYIYANFSITDGSTTATASGGTGSNVSTFSQAAGSGWYRIGISGITSTTGGTVAGYIQFLTSGVGATTYVGDNVSGMYLWGAQIEGSTAVGNNFPMPSSYIATTNAAVTRQTDVLSVTSFSSVYNSAEWTVIADLSRPFYEPTSVSSFPRIFNICISATCTTNRVSMFYDTANRKFTGADFIAGVQQGASSTSVAPSANEVHQLGIVKTSSNTIQVFDNGTAYTATGSISLPAVDSLFLNESGVNTFIHYRKLTYRKRAVSSANMIKLTSD